MGDFLRDTKVSFLTIGEKELEEIDGDLKEILSRATPDDQASISYILRFDGMGIIRTDFEEIKRSFNRAKKVERIVFQLTSPKNFQNKGKNIQIYLDNLIADSSYIVVADDDEAWVDSNFGRLKKRLEGHENGNWLAHSTLVEMLVQLLGVFFGFAMCLIFANLLALSVSIKYSFFVLFLGLFLIFSNLWTYMLRLIGKARIYFWPYISFKKEPIGLIGQTVIAFIITLVLTKLMNIGWKILINLGSIATK